MPCFFVNKKIIALAIGGALFVTLVYNIPYFIIKGELNSQGLNYHPLTIFADYDEGVTYGPLIKEGIEKLKLEDPALREYQGAPSLLSYTGAVFLGFLGRLFGGIEPFRVAINFIFPPIIFLLFFMIVYILTKSPPLSLFLGFVFIFTLGIAYLPPFSKFQQLIDFAVFFKPYISSAVKYQRLIFSRIFSPGWTFIPLTSFFLLLVVSFYRRTNKFFILTGLTYGVLFYTYFYDWIAVSVILGILFCIAVLARNLSLARQVGILMAVGLLTSTFYWINYWQISHLLQHGDIMNRTGLEIGRVFRWSFLPHYVFWLLLAGWLWMRKSKDLFSYLAIAIFVSGVVDLNVQLITGYIPQPTHFLNYPLAISLFIAYVICAMKFLEDYRGHLPNLRFYMTAVVGLGTLLISARAVQFQLSYAHNNAWRYTIPGATEDSLEWLRDNIKEDSVVLSPNYITNSYLMTLTPAKVFYPASGLVTTAFNKEIIERFIISAKLFGVTDARIRQLFNYDYIVNFRGDMRFSEDNILEHMMEYGLVSQEPDPPIGFPGYRDFTEIEKEADSILKEWHANRESLLKKYSFEYLYVGPSEKIYGFSEENFPYCLKKVYQNKEVDIYHVCPI